MDIGQGIAIAGMWGSFAFIATSKKANIEFLWWIFIAVIIFTFFLID